MPRLTALDELFVHQLPEPLPATAIEHHHWRESYFFIVFERERNDGDVLVVAMATYPARGMLDTIVAGRVDGRPIGFYATRPANGDPHTSTVGPVTVDVLEPYERFRVRADTPAVTLDLDVTARTRPYGLRRGRLLADDASLLWDQSHMFQSIAVDGSYTVDGAARPIAGWWGQRDHSWGVRDHGRIPLWMWLAIQLPDGMLGVWNWELPNGARIYTDGCWAPADGSEPVPVVGFEHDLQWLVDGEPAAWGTTTATGAVTGLAGHVRFVLEDGQTIGVDGEGTWCMPYGPFHGGGQHLMAVRTDDGREGVAAYEVTGRDHHRFFPTPLSPT